MNAMNQEKSHTLQRLLAYIHVYTYEYRWKIQAESHNRKFAGGLISLRGRKMQNDFLLSFALETIYSRTNIFSVDKRYYTHISRAAWENVDKKRGKTFILWN